MNSHLVNISLVTASGIKISKSLGRTPLESPLDLHDDNLML